MRVPSLPVLALAPILVLPGCGGEPLTREAYVAQGTAICVEAQRDLAALEQRDLPVDEAGPKAAEIGERQVEDLLELEPPKSLAAKRERLEALVDDVREIGREAAGSGDDDALEKLNAKGREADRVLAELGLGRCGDDAP